jgi:hypothetical protein
MSRIRFGSRTINLPRSRLVRIIIGIALILGGIVGFLPVLGFWMIPLGLLVLSVDLPAVRRWRREASVRFGRWMKRHFPKFGRRSEG